MIATRLAHKPAHGGYPGMVIISAPIPPKPRIPSNVRGTEWGPDPQPKRTTRRFPTYVEPAIDPPEFG